MSGFGCCDISAAGTLNKGNYCTVDCNAVAGNYQVEDICTINNEIEKIKEEYENRLQKQKVHISGGDRIQGNRIYGRRRTVAIRKRSFRNKKGIIGSPT